MSRPHVECSVCFVLSNNRPVSVSRITANLACAFVQRGIETTVMFPVVDWFDYQLWQMARQGLLGKAKWTLRLVLELVWNGLLRRRWCGFTYYGADPRVRATRYFLRPPWVPRHANEVTVIHHTYLIPRLMSGLADHQVKILGVVHNPFELELRSPDPVHAAWKRHCVAIERLLNMPRVAVSEQAKRSAEQLGIRVGPVIHNGIDLDTFRSGVRPAGRPITVSLYCATHPQKGQSVGLEVVRRLRASFGRRIRLCSIGKLLPNAAPFFDHHFGYLHGSAYVRALQDTDIFIYPSLYDGFPAPPLEAMACGCALATTAVQGVVEYALSEENCLLCEPGNAEQLYEAAARLINEEPLRQRLQANGPRTAQAHSVERSAQRLLEFLMSLDHVREAVSDADVERALAGRD